MKYLVYMRRKNLEFNKEMVALRYSSDADYDPTDAIKQLTGLFWPKEKEELDMETVSRIYELNEEVKKTIKVVVKDGKPQVQIG